MRGAATFTLLLALAGCSALRGPQVAIPPEENTPAHQECRQQARNSPEARRFWQQMAPDQNNADRLRNEARAAELRVYRQCLAEHGLPQSGGVAPVRN